MFKIIVSTAEEKEQILWESSMAWDYAEDEDLIPEDNITSRLHFNPDVIVVDPEFLISDD